MISVKTKEIFITKLLISIASLVIVIAGIKAASTVLIPITIAIFLALFSLALLKGFSKIKVPKFLAIIIVMGVLILSIVLFIDLLRSSIVDFNNALPEYKAKFNTVVSSTTSYLSSKGINVSENKIYEFFTLDQMMDFFLKSLKGIMGTVSNIVLVLVLVMFILFESTAFSKKFQFAFKDSEKAKHFSKTSEEIQKYILIKSITSFITGILVYCFVLFLGLDFPALWGLSAFLFNYIPIIGSIVASIPPILLAIIQLGFGDAGIVAIGYVLINWGVSYFIEPLMMGKNLGISPLVVILSVFFWGWVWGPAGMLLSVPLMMVIKILLVHSKDFYWVGILMGDSASLKNKAQNKE